MLEQLLQTMATSDGPTAVRDMAGRLGVSAELVEQMIEQLVRLGYFEEVAPSCDAGSCRGCAQAGACTLRPQARLWAVTEKGRRHSANGSKGHA